MAQCLCVATATSARPSGFPAVQVHLDLLVAGHPRRRWRTCGRHCGGSPISPALESDQLGAASPTHAHRGSCGGCRRRSPGSGACDFVHLDQLAISGHTSVGFTSSRERHRCPVTRRFVYTVSQRGTYVAQRDDREGADASKFIILVAASTNEIIRG